MPVLQRWIDRGYQVAVQRDPGAADLPVDLSLTRPYKGYADAVNFLADTVLGIDPDCDFVVTGGDDVLPDPTHNPQQIAAECTLHFKGTLGVMQPCGDRHMVDREGKCAAERVCVSPWMGREWCERAYDGTGPMCSLYFHEFVDADLHCVALKHRCLWHRRDITQMHQWWGRTDKKEKPEHLVELEAKWDEVKAFFEARKAAGFPDSDLK